MTEQTDLFGHPAGPAQQSLFGEGPERLSAPSQAFKADPERVRRKLMRVLGQARAAERLPWSEHETRMWQTVFPNMANWLPEDEARQLRFEFAREMERLRAA